MLPEKCVSCGKKEIKIKKRGLCQSCYSLWFKHKQYLFLGEKIVKRPHMPLKEIKKQQESLEKKKPSKLDILEKRMNEKYGVGLFDSILQIAKTGEGNLTALAKKHGVTKQSISELLNKYFY